MIAQAIRRILREPLLHFALLGAALFGAYAVVRPDSSDSSAIVVSSDRIAAIVAQFRGTWQRPPLQDEVDALIESYVRQEVFYREGVALGLDRDDLVVRNRVKQKLEMLSADALAAEPSEADLQEYLADHCEVFGIPAAMSFEQVYFDPDQHGDQLERDIQQALAALRTGRDRVGFGDRTLLPPRMEGALPSDISAVFGDAFATAIRDLSPGTWSGPMASSFGHHLVRITWKGEAVAPALDEVRDAVLREWSYAQAVDAREQLYQSLRKRYTVTIAPAPPVANTGARQ